jgi:hypothetical protein
VQRTVDPADAVEVLPVVVLPVVHSVPPDSGPA